MQAHTIGDRANNAHTFTYKNRNNNHNSSSRNNLNSLKLTELQLNVYRNWKVRRRLFFRLLQTSWWSRSDWTVFFFDGTNFWLTIALFSITLFSAVCVERVCLVCCSFRIPFQKIYCTWSVAGDHTPLPYKHTHFYIKYIYLVSDLHTHTHKLTVGQAGSHTDTHASNNQTLRKKEWEKKRKGNDAVKDRQR